MFLFGCLARYTYDNPYILTKGFINIHMSMPGFTAVKSLTNRRYGSNTRGTSKFKSDEKILPQMRRTAGRPYWYDECFYQDWEDAEGGTSGSSIIYCL